VSRIDAPTEALRLIASMADPAMRLDAAREFARRWDADDLTIFVRDAGVGRSLPAPGFAQTLRGARAWRELVERAVTDGTAEGSVQDADGEMRHAVALGSADGTAAVFRGGSLADDERPILCAILPLLGACFRMEAAVARAEVESRIERQAAAQATSLAAKLDATRAELQHALSVAESASRARDEFLATVSHELRTPLTSIIGWIQLLRETPGDPQALAEGLDTIDRNARAQSRLIEDILDFSRINAGKLRLTVRPLDLSDVIDAAIDIVKPAADAKGIRIDRLLDTEAGRISGDADRLQQVVWNLLSNAVKFTPKGGRVQVRLERVNSHCELAISDTGVGISAEFLPYVFDRFSQADSSSSRAHGGLGLGLGIVRHLVELHGGTVQAFSPGIGKGATFAVHLPLLVAHHRSAEPPPRLELPPIRESEQEYSDLTGVSVLIVEDNHDARKLLETILRRAGAEVRAAENVASALRILAGEWPDCIVSDIEMPGEDGYSFIRKVRLQEPASRHIPAIALTAYTRSVDRVRALAAGFQTHMSKPVEPSELVATVRSLVAGQRKLSA
jgi:signal transduction histidine kinase/ActR/RegA family two-component response regulator